MCTTLDLCILNGVCYGDQEGRFTYISDFGSSVIDYFLMSRDLFACLYDQCNLSVTDRIESSHMPVVLNIKCSFNPVKDADEESGATIDKFVWNNDCLPFFVDELCSETIKDTLNEAIDVMDFNIDLALDMFNDCLKKAANCMKKSCRLNFKRNLQNWFDYECKVAKKKVRRLLKKYRRTLTDVDRAAFCQAQGNIKI